jgi:hypothetical protein
MTGATIGPERIALAFDPAAAAALIWVNVYAAGCAASTVFYRQITGGDPGPGLKHLRLRDNNAYFTDYKN